MADNATCPPQKLGLTLSSLPRSRRILENAVHHAPNHGGCWAMLSMMYWHEFSNGFNSQPDPLVRALDSARRAVELAPSNNLAYRALAQVSFSMRDSSAFRPAAERSIELNRMDGSNLAFLGALIAYSGDWEHECAMAESVSKLNPNRPSWRWFLPFYNAYRKGEYQQALEAALKVNLRGNFLPSAARAAVLGQLGQPEAAQKALKEVLTLNPGFAGMARDFYGRWQSPELVEHLIEGLRKAAWNPKRSSPSRTTWRQRGSFPRLPTLTVFCPTR